MEKLGKGPGRSTANKIIDKVFLGNHNNRASCPKENLEFKPFLSPGLALKETAMLIGKKEQKNST